MQLKLLRQRLAARHIELHLTDAGKEHLGRAGYDSVYGARPLKRFWLGHVGTVFSRELQTGDSTDSAG